MQAGPSAARPAAAPGLFIIYYLLFILITITKNAFASRALGGSADGGPGPIYYLLFIIYPYNNNKKTYMDVEMTPLWYPKWTLKLVTFGTPKCLIYSVNP